MYKRIVVFIITTLHFSFLFAQASTKPAANTFQSASHLPVAAILGAFPPK